MTWQRKLGLKVWLWWMVPCAAFVAVMGFTAPPQENNTMFYVLLAVFLGLVAIVGGMHAYLHVCYANEKLTRSMFRGMGWK